MCPPRENEVQGSRESTKYNKTRDRIAYRPLSILLFTAGRYFDLVTQEDEPRRAFLVAAATSSLDLVWNVGKVPGQLKASAPNGRRNMAKIKAKKKICIVVSPKGVF
jgi:hypothetical protein